MTLASTLGMMFRQLFDPQSSTYTYLLADPATAEAVLIDPVLEQTARDVALLRELGLKLRWTLETHVHADHVTSSGVLRTRLGSRSVMSKQAGVGCADFLVDEGDEVRFGAEVLEVRATPGHTSCSVSFVHHESRRVFTGDALLIRGCGRTDFQQGDPRTLYQSVHGRLFSLGDDYEIYPAHDYKGHTMSTVGEERTHNPRLGASKTEQEFVEIMTNLELPRPKLIDVAVPANQNCGLERQDAEASSWAPIARTAAGIPEVTVDWVAQNAAGRGFRVVDVREPSEWVGELGHISEAELVPLATVGDAAAAWEHSQPLVVVCRSGGRSGKAAVQLEGLGFQQVASMAGGMLAWNERRLPVAGSDSRPA